MNEYYTLRAAGFTDQEIQADMRGKLKSAGFTDQEANAEVFQQSIAPDQRAYDALNKPNPALLDYFGRAFTKAQAEVPATSPKAPVGPGGPADAALVDPALHPGEYLDVTARPEPTFSQAIGTGANQSVVGLFLAHLMGKDKAPQSVMGDMGPAEFKPGLSPEQIQDLPHGKRIAMQVAQVAGDLPAMALGAAGGASEGPLAVGGAFAMPAALRSILMAEYEKGEIQTPKEFIQRGASALWAAAKGEAVGLSTYGAGAGASLASPILKVPAEVVAMTTAGEAVEGHLPKAQDFVDGAILIAALHGATAIGGEAVRAAQDITPKLRAIYAKTGIRPEQVIADAKADPSIREDLLTGKGPEIPQAYDHAPWDDPDWKPTGSGDNAVAPDAADAPTIENVETRNDANGVKYVYENRLSADETITTEYAATASGVYRKSKFPSGKQTNSVLNEEGEFVDAGEINRRGDTTDPAARAWHGDADTSDFLARLGALMENIDLSSAQVQKLSDIFARLARGEITQEQARVEAKSITAPASEFTPPRMTKADLSSQFEEDISHNLAWRLKSYLLYGADPLGEQASASIARAKETGRVVSGKFGLDYDDAVYHWGKEGVEGIQRGLVRRGGERLDQLMQRWGIDDPQVVYDALHFNKAAARERYLEGGGMGDVAATGGFTSGMAANRSVTPADDLTKISDVVKLLQEKLDTPIRTGKIATRGALGIFKPHDEVIRSRVANDISTISHEVGHAVQKLMFGDVKGPALKPWAAELAPIATRPRAGQSPLPEGFAEFVSRYVQDEAEARKVAPRFYEEFEKRLDAKAPQVKQVLLEARAMVQKWREQPALMRVLSHISVGESGKPGILERVTSRDTYSDLYRRIVDRTNPIDNLVKEGLKPGEKLAADMDPYKVARVFAAWAGKASHFLDASPFEFGTYKNVGKSLHDILAPVEDMNALRAYLVAKSQLERGERGMISPDFSKDSAAVVAALKDKYEPIAKEIYAYKDHVLNYLRDSGVVSSGTVEALRAMWKSHVPFYRVMEDIERSPGGGSAMQAKDPLHKAKGSGRDIVDPLESIIRDTYLFVNMAERNAVVESLVRFAETHEGLGRWVEKVPVQMVPTTVRTDEVLRALTDSGEFTKAELRQLKDADFDTTIFRPSSYLDKTSQMALYRDGKRTVYQVDPQIAEIVHGLDHESSNILVRLASVPTQLLRAGATLTPEFLTRNLTRDSFDAYIYSKYGFIPGVDTMRGLFHALKRDDLYHDWVKSGGEHSMFVSLDREGLQKTLADIAATGATDHVRNTIRHPVEALRIVSEFSESANRLGEYAKARKALGDSKAAMIEAGYASRDLPLDFARIGANTRAVNALIAFWNARIQGLDKMVRAFKDAPMQTTAKALVSITLPSVILEVASFVNEPQQEQDRVWQKAALGQELNPGEESLYLRMQIHELPAWQRDLFWCVPAGGIIWRIPKPFEMGTIFGSIPERVTRWALGRMHKNSDGKEFKDLLSSLGSGAWPGAMLTAAAPFIENYANKSSLSGRGIVPASREGMLPELQYTPNTTQLMRALSAQIGELPNMRAYTFSPAKAENIIQGWTGGLGSYALRGADWALRKAGVVPDPVTPAANLADIPFIKGFVARYPSMNTESIATFYENYAQSQAYVKSISGLQKEMQFSDAAKLLGESDFNILASAHEAMSEQNAFIQKINNNPTLNPTKKRELIDSAYLQMNMTAKRGNMAFERMQQIIKAHKGAQQ